MNTNVIIGNNIQRHRHLKGMKQDTLAKMLDITSAAVSLIETGKSSITINRLMQIAKILEIDFRELLNFPNDFL